MENCIIAVYAVLGDFKRWNQANYIIEDYFKDTDHKKRSRRVYGLEVGGDNALKPCVYSEAAEACCRPFTTSVAEYALALHKLLHEKCHVHMTFFTPLTLLKDVFDDKSSKSVIEYEDMLNGVKKLAEELGKKMYEPGRKCHVWSSIAYSLTNAARIERPVWSPLAVVSSDAKVTLADSEERLIKTYMVPVPARLNENDRTRGKLFIYRADIEDAERVASAWISKSLRELRPRLAVLDTTHGVNYIALLIERAFRHAASTLPINERVYVQIYNTDPVVGGPSPEVKYKYHLLEETSYFNVSSLVRSPPSLALELKMRSDRIEEFLSSGIDILHSIKKSYLEDIIHSIKLASYSFDNDVILWGFVFIYIAQALMKKLMEELPDNFKRPAWLQIRGYVERQDKIVKVNQYLAIIGDKGDKRDVAMRAKLLLAIYELEWLLYTLSDVWAKIRRMLGIQEIRSVDGPGLDDVECIKCLLEYTRHGSCRDREYSSSPGCSPCIAISYCLYDRGEESPYPEYLPVAAYTLLRSELRDSIPKYARGSAREGEKSDCKGSGSGTGLEQTLNKRNFIAHGGLSRGVAVNAFEEKSKNCYCVVVDLRGLARVLGPA